MFRRFTNLYTLHAARLVSRFSHDGRALSLTVRECVSGDTVVSGISISGRKLVVVLAGDEEEVALSIKAAKEGQVVKPCRCCTLLYSGTTAGWSLKCHGRLTVKISSTLITGL